ncbi:hypothetical protein ACGFSB_28305 [Streptomyces sp. NPDC048441]|uniref:hypothetical protein n=1 Tax=Streptomyces sp. NPDC048441 TaxID=3365552 RepID=UPI0037142019
MGTRQRRRTGGAVSTALFALAFLFLVPLLGIEGPPGPAAATVAHDRGAAAASAVFGPYVESRDGARDGGRGCHEGENRVPGVALPAPERTSSPTFDPASTPYVPRDDVPASPGASPPDSTSVDLYRTQVIRT